MKKGSKSTGSKVAPFTSIVDKQDARKREYRQPVALLAERCENSESDWTNYVPMKYEPEDTDKVSWLDYKPLKKLKEKVSYDDLRSVYARKMKTLINYAPKLRQRFDGEKYSVQERNWRLMAIIAFNSGYWMSKDDCEYTQFRAIGGRNWDLKKRKSWIKVVNRLNNMLGTNVTADDIYEYRLHENEDRVGKYSPEFKQNPTAVTEQYIKELDCIDYIKGIVRYSKKGKKKALGTKQKRKIGKRRISKNDRLIVAEYNITYVETSFLYVYNAMYEDYDLLKRCIIHDDGTLEINMAEMPIMMVRSTHGLRFRNKTMPLVYILFGPKCPEALHDKYTEYARRFVFHERIVKDNKYVYTDEPYRDLLRYIDLAAASIDYWVKNPEVRYRTNEQEMKGKKRTLPSAFEGTLFIRPDGSISYKDPDGVQTEWEEDPALNSKGNPEVSEALPVEEEDK